MGQDNAIYKFRFVFNICQRIIMVFCRFCEKIAKALKERMTGLSEVFELKWFDFQNIGTIV